MIDLIDVSKSYGPGLPAVNHANLHIDKGEFVFVVGNSGSGKTTLIKLLMKELDSTSGQIIVSGERLEGMKHRRVAKYRRKLGVVFQDFRLLKDRNVYENVAFAQRVVNRPTRVIRKRVPDFRKLDLRSNTNPSRMNFPVENSRELHWQGRWSTVRISFWQTSLQEIWIRRLPKKS